MGEELKYILEKIRESTKEVINFIKHNKECGNMSKNDDSIDEIKKIWKRIVKMEKDLYGVENPLPSLEEKSLGGELLKRNRKLKERFEELENKYKYSYEKLENSYENRFRELQYKYVDLCENLQQNSGNQERKITRLNEEKQELREKNAELSQEINRLTQETRSLERLKEELEERCTRLQNKSSDTEKTLGEVRWNLEKTQSELENKEMELEKIQSELVNKGRELEKTYSELSDKNMELEKTKSELSNKNMELETAYTDLDKRKKELEEANLQIGQQQEEISKTTSLLELAKKELSDEREQLNAELSSVRNILQEKEGELDSTRNILNRTEETLSNKERELTNTQGELSSTQQQLGNYSKQFGNWGDVTQDYRNILFKMYSCPSLREIVTKFSLETNTENADTIDNVLKFIGVVGVGNSFALEVYNVMRTYKREQQDYLNEDELKFIDELNRYYRKVLQVEFDVLDVPATEKFESTAMQDINKTTGAFRNISGVYVPGLRGDEKTLKQKAIVQGTRN